jgi:DNA polymerase-3 subunit alpha
MEQQSAIFVNGCTENGLDREYAIEIFALMEKFASYGFNKSHAAAYAVISYQTAYLKAHYTAEFLAASMNLDIGDTGKIWMFSNEAKIFGIEVLLPDINASSAYFKINDGKILYGLAAIKGVGIKIIDEIEIRKNKNGGEFKNLGEFISLCSDCLNKRAMESLVKAGAFDSLHANRGELYENLENLIQQSNFDCSNKNQGSLFFEDINRQEIILTPKSDWDKKVKLSLEFSALGFYLSSHPLDEYRDRFARIGITEIERVPEISLNRGQKIITAGVLSSKKVKSSKRGRYAFLQLTDQGSTVDLSIFDEKLLIENNKILEVGNAIVCEVEIRNEDGNNRILITKLKEAHKFIKESIKYYQIHIRDTDEIDKIKKVLNYKEGVPVTLNAELKCGSIIRFD